MFAYGQAFNFCCQELVKSKHEQHANLWSSKSLIIKKITQTWCLGLYHIYKTWPGTAKNSIQSQFRGVHISTHAKEVPSGNPLFAAIPYIFMKKTSNCITSSERQKASHAKLLKIVTWPSMWPPALNWNHTCVIFPNLINTTFYLVEQYIL